MILERCLLRRGARVTREGERTWRTLSHVDTAVDSLYTDGSALPPSVFAGMIVCYHPLSSLFPRLSRFNEKLFHPPYKYSDHLYKVINPHTCISAGSACSVRRRNDLRFVLTGWRPPRVAPPPRPRPSAVCTYSRLAVSPPLITPTRNTRRPSPWKLDAGRGMELSRLDSHWRFISPESDRRSLVLLRLIWCSREANGAPPLRLSPRGV